jgi:site-specific recombinase
MSDTAALSGFIFLTLVLMFGGRKRRSFAEASHKAAALIVGILCMAALLVFITGSISHLFGLAATNHNAPTYIAQADDR